MQVVRSRHLRREALAPRAVAVLLFIVFSIALCPTPSEAYSVLTHEAIVDSAWDPSIKPLLLDRFPHLTPEQLKEAHSYAYGGCIIQDMGYYPFGSHLFTNLLHYVRSGDFINTLLRDAQDQNEYAFALGAMAHYFADTSGHSIAINPGLPIRYPKLRAEYGTVVTYEEAPKQHILVEFSFDVVQVAGGAYAPQAYHDFIGFQVAKPLLERAFQETYGIDLKSIFLSEDLALGTYRRAVSKTIPDMTRVAWKQKRNEIEKIAPGVRREKYVYKLPTRKYRAEFGSDYRRPSIGSEILVFLFRIIPKVGPFRAFAFRAPTPQMEKLFQESFAEARDRYKAELAEFKNGPVELPNEDFDTGKPTAPGEYELADETYDQLLDKLADAKFTNVPSALSSNIIAFYAMRGGDPPEPKKEQERWGKTQKELEELKSATGHTQSTQAINDTAPAR